MRRRRSTQGDVHRRAGGVEIPLWPQSERAWQLSGRVSPRYVNYFLRFRSGKGLPEMIRARFTAMLIPQETIDRALGEVHRLDDWVGAWSRAAQRFLGEARRAEGDGDWEAAAVARRNAAMCYHVAHLITDDDPRTVRALRAAGVKAFSQAIPRLIPGTRKVGIHWRTRMLPGYFAKPVELNEPAPLVVLLNGATTTKEETLLWSSALLDHGLPVLALDWPGTGEAIDGQRLSSYCDDMTDGLVEFALAEPGIDPDRIAMLGVSLGAVVAVRAAAMDRRIAAAVAVTPPFDPRPWASRINPIVARQLVSLAGQAPSVPVLLDDFCLADVTRRLRTPLLVFGAARDLVVPPEEAMHLAAAAGDLGTLVWYDDAGHGLYDRIDDWMPLTARWLMAVFDMAVEEDPEDTEAPVSTWVDETDDVSEQSVPPEQDVGSTAQRSLADSTDPVDEGSTTQVETALASNGSHAEASGSDAAEEAEDPGDAVIEQRKST